MSWRVLIGLIVCNAIWATNPLMGKKLMQEYSPLQVSWLRYGSGLFSLLLVLPFIRAPLTRPREIFRGTVLPWVFTMGLFTFFGSPLLQYRGLALSTATANAIIVAMEPLFAVVLAWAFLKESMGWKELAAFALAIVGFSLLSNIKPHDVSGSLALFSIGNLMILMALPMEAIYTIISRKLAGRVEPISLFLAAILFGFSLLTIYLLSSGSLPSVAPSFSGWLSILWLGPLGTAATYIFWTKALEKASVAAVSLTLFVQPILGALFGAFILQEKLEPWQMAGGLCILGALIWQTYLVKGQS